MTVHQQAHTYTAAAVQANGHAKGRSQPLTAPRAPIYTMKVRGDTQQRWQGSQMLPLEQGACHSCIIHPSPLGAALKRTQHGTAGHTMMQSTAGHNIGRQAAPRLRRPADALSNQL